MDSLETARILMHLRELEDECRELKDRCHSLIGENSFLRSENAALKSGLVECCDRLWYYFGGTDGKWLSNQAQNVYDNAKHHLDWAGKIEKSREKQ